MNGEFGRLFKRLFKVFVLVLVLCPVVPVEAEEIRIGGTGGGLAIITRLAAEYKRNHPAVTVKRTVTVKVLPSLGSAGGIKALTAGALDLAITAIPADKASGLVSMAFGRTPFVFATAKSRPLSGVTMREVEDLYSGRTSKWPDGSRSRVVLRPATEYDISLLKSMSPEMDRSISGALAREGMIIGVTDHDNADAIETVPGAVGAITLGQLLAEERKLKPLALNGIKPGLDTLANGSYSYSKSYYIITRPQPGPLVSSFLDFVRSATAKKILTGAGYLAAGR